MALSAAPNTLSTMDGLFKSVYDDKLRDVVPNFALLQADIPFKKGKRTGKQFLSPIVLGMEQGVVYALSGAGAFSLATVAAKAATMQEASLVGSQIVLSSQIDYETAASADSGKAAFENSTGAMVRNMWKSMRKRVELNMLYGGVGLGIVSSVNATAGTIVLKSTKWADGIWAGMEGAQLQFASGTTTSSSDAIITGVNLSTRTLTFNTTTSVKLVTAADVAYFTSSITGGVGSNEAKGIISLLNSPTNVFGITCASYSLWNPTVYDGGATAGAFVDIQRALAKGVAKGLDSDVVCYMNPGDWEKLSTTQSAYRVYDSSYTKTRYETGAEELRFHSQTGMITVKPHPFVWAGYAPIIDPKLWSRIGATDVTFNRANMGGSVDRSASFFIEMETKAGYELRCYSHQALFTEALGKGVLLYSF